MLAVVLLAAAAASVPTQPLHGIARATDGDSLTIGETRVRLFGIDAPEFDQVCTRGSRQWSCGMEAANQLSKLVTGRQVQCDQLGTDKYGRALGRCFVGTVEVNGAMVAMGYALAFRRYSEDYVASEESAKASKRGLWSGTFEMPAEVRATARSETKRRPTNHTRGRSATTAANSGPSCNIKGNHSRRGEWIYHLPGMPYYAQTRPEAMFCSEAEAQAAGYRRAKVR